MSQGHAAVVEQPAPGWRGRSHARSRQWAVRIGAPAAIGLVLLALHWPFSRQKVIDALQDDFHGQVTIARFDKTFFPHPGFVAQGVTLVRPGTPANPPFASAQKFVLRAHYIDMLLRPRYLARIELQGLSIHIPPVGSMPETPPDQNPSSTRVGEVIANDALLEIARESAEPLRYQFHQLTLSSVSRKDGLTYDAAFLNALPPGEIETRGHFGPWDKADPGQTPLSGTYKFEHAYLGKFEGIDGVLTSHDSYEGTLRQIQTRGTVNIPDFHVHDAGRSVPIDARFQAIVDALNGDVRLDHVEASVVKTEVLAHGQIQGRPNQKGKTTSVDLNVSKGRIQDLLRLFVREPRSPFTGIISFQAHANIPPDGRPFKQEVELVGDFGLDDGRFTKPHTQEEIKTLSDRAEGKKTDKDKPDKKTNPEDADEDDPARVMSSLKGHVVLRNGVATLTKVTFTVPGAVANMHGTYNLENEKIDFHGTLKTDAEFSKVGGGGIKSILLKPFDAIFKKKKGGAEIPVKMTGTYSHPQTGLEISGGKSSGEKK